MFLRFRSRTKIEKVTKSSDVVIEGRVIAKDTISVSGTSVRCVYYDKMKESYQRPMRGAGRKMWIPQGVEQRCAGFYIDDGTGRVWIPEKTDGLLVREGVTTRGLEGKKGIRRYVAQLLREGDIIRARGAVDTPRGSEPAVNFSLRAGKKGRLEILVRRRLSAPVEQGDRHPKPK